MVQLMVKLKVKDFGQWKQGFEKGSELRRNNGSKGSRIFQRTDDPNEIYFLFDWDSLDKARAFFQSAELRERMEQAGVIGGPEVTFLEEKAKMDV